MKKDGSIWADNVHLRKPSEGDTNQNRRILANYKQICADDKFIDFVHHVENQKRLTFMSSMKEIALKQAAGQNRQNPDLINMMFLVADQEAELESRDMTNHSKSAVPKLDHAEFACVGSESCLRQRMIPKLFVDSLAMQKGGLNQ